MHQRLRKKASRINTAFLPQRAHTRHGQTHGKKVLTFANFTMVLLCVSAKHEETGRFGRRVTKQLLHTRGSAYSVGHWAGKTEKWKTRSLLSCSARSRRPAHTAASTNHGWGLHLQRARASPTLAGRSREAHHAAPSTDTVACWCSSLINAWRE